MAAGGLSRISTVARKGWAARTPSGRPPILRSSRSPPSSSSSSAAAKAKLFSVSSAAKVTLAGTPE